MSDGAKAILAAVVVAGLLYYFYVSSSPATGMAGPGYGPLGGQGGLIPLPGQGNQPPSAVLTTALSSSAKGVATVAATFGNPGAGAAGTSSTGYVAPPVPAFTALPATSLTQHVLPLGTPAPSLASITGTKPNVGKIGGSVGGLFKV